MYFVMNLYHLLINGNGLAVEVNFRPFETKAFTAPQTSYCSECDCRLPKTVFSNCYLQQRTNLLRAVCGCLELFCLWDICYTEQWILDQQAFLYGMSKSSVQNTVDVEYGFC